MADKKDPVYYDTLDEFLNSPEIETYVAHLSDSPSAGVKENTRTLLRSMLSTAWILSNLACLRNSYVFRPGMLIGFTHAAAEERARQILEQLQSDLVGNEAAIKVMSTVYMRGVLDLAVKITT